MKCLTICVVALAISFASVGSASAQQGPKSSKSEPTQEQKENVGILAGTGIAVMVAVAAVGFLIYFAPTGIALMRSHGNIGPILIVNVFLGWTGIGWVVALAWAFSGQDAPRYRRGY